MSSVTIATACLSTSYGATVALADLTLEVARGEVFGLLGHNGAGKTTTVSILTTLLAPSSGAAIVDGHDVVTDSLGARRTLGYLPENVRFCDNLTLMEGLRFFARLVNALADRHRSPGSLVTGASAPGFRVSSSLGLVNQLVYVLAP